MTKEGSSKIVNFMTPGAGVLVLGHGHISIGLRDLQNLNGKFKNGLFSLPVLIIYL